MRPTKAQALSGQINHVAERTATAVEHLAKLQQADLVRMRQRMDGLEADIANLQDQLEHFVEPTAREAREYGFEFLGFRRRGFVGRLRWLVRGR